MRRRLLALSISASLILALAAAVAIWRPWSPRTVALARDWQATVRVIGGNGTSAARDGDATHARLSDPFGVAIGPDGTIYVADAGDAQRIRRLAPDGSVTTLAGGVRGFADGPGDAARFDTPSGLAIDAGGALYLADTGNNAIRRISPDGQVTTIAGDGLPGHRDGPGSQARFNGPVGVAVAPDGRVIVADTYNDRIRAIGLDGSVTTIAGAGSPGLVDGPAEIAQFDTPCGVAIDEHGRIHVADTGNGLLRVVDAIGSVTTPSTLYPDGPFRPIGIALAGAVTYVVDESGRVVEITDGRTVRTLAGAAPGFRDGSASEARFRRPAGIAANGVGRVVVADAGNSLVRLVSAPSRLDVRLPAPPHAAPRFDAERFNWQPLLWPIAPMDGPHEIAGTLGEARGGDGAERFHAGVDVRTDEGTPVLAVRDGVVASPASAHDFGSLGESLRIGPIAYVHIRTGRRRGAPSSQPAFDDPARFVPTYDATGALVRIRVKRGARFATGEPIGTVNAFNHVHLNVGWPGEEINPLRFRWLQFEDTVPPTIARGGVRLFDEHGQPLTRRARGRVLVSGRARIVVDAWDQIDGNRPQRRLGLYALGYQILERGGAPAAGFESPRYTQRFDRLALDPEAPRIVYADGSGIPFYGSRRTRFLYVVTNSFHDGHAAEGFWDTATLAPGDYILRAWASDIRGNLAFSNRDLPITIVPAIVQRP
jgi:streptogramin lyase